MTKMKTGDTIRQGDVLLIKVDTIDETAEPVTEDHGALPIAYGESTHHRHQVAGAASGNKMFRRGSAQWLEVTAKGGAVLEVTSDRGEKLTPERHDPIQLPKGRFGIVTQEAYEPEAYVPVGD